MTKEQLAEAMRQVLMEADNNHHDEWYTTDRRIVEEGLDRLAEKLGLSYWWREPQDAVPTPAVKEQARVVLLAGNHLGQAASGPHAKRQDG